MFNIGDYASHTQHLDIVEDLAYRRMLEWCYLHESPLPDCIEQISRLIRMRSHSDCIAVVLREFFELGEYGWFSPRVQREIDAYKEKSVKAKASAAARWSAKPIKRDANALRTECEKDADAMLTTNQEPLTINQEPLTKVIREKRFSAPSADEVYAYMADEGCANADKESLKFTDYYTANGWRVGKNPMKDWKAAARNWMKNASTYSAPAAKVDRYNPDQSAFFNLAKTKTNVIDGSVVANQHLELSYEPEF